MATSFPSSLDSLTNPSSGDSLSSPSHSGQHADANDAIEALQAKVGVDGSAVTTSLDYKVTNGVLSGLNVDSGVLYVDAANNRVGINNQSPAYALDVTGDINASASLRIAGDAIGTWTSYTPTWTGSTTDPSVGSGFIEGRYCRVQTLVIVSGYVIPGAGWSAGSGNYRVSLPIDARGTNAPIGYATLLDASAGYVGYFGSAIRQSATTAEFRIGNGAGIWSSSVPITLAQSDQMRFTLIYEAA